MSSEVMGAPRPEPLDERRFRALASLTEICWRTDPHGSLFEISPSWRALTGQDPAELSSGHGWLRAIHPDDRQTTIDAFAHGTPFAVDQRVRGADGIYRRMLARAAPVRDDHGAVLEYVGTHSPLEAALSQQLLEAVLEEMPCGVVVRDMAGGIMLRNRRLREMAPLVQAAYDLRTPDGRIVEPPQYPLRRAARGEVIVGERFVYRNENGTYTVELSSSPVRDASGAIVAVVGTLQDVSRKSEAEELLRRSEAELRLLADALPAMVWSARSDGVAVWYNKETRRWFGEPGPEGFQRWQDVLHPDDRARAMETYRRCVADGVPYEIEYRLADETGAYRWFLARGAPLRIDGRVERWVGTCIDIDPQKQAEAASQRIAAFHNELLGIVGHDLRDPLNTVTLGVALLRASGLEERQHQPVRRIAAGAERAVRMLETLLDFTQARLGGGLRVNRAAMDVAAVCGELVSEYASAGAPVRLIAEGDCAGRWDRARVEQMLSNLLRNALQYGTPGRDVLVRCIGVGERVELSVANEGPAIPAAVQATLFEPFRSGADRGRRNLGLGLYIVKQIAQAHGGDVSVRSSAADGTVFTVTLPRNG